MDKPWRRFFDPSRITLLVGIPTILVAGILSYRETQTLELPSVVSLAVVLGLIVLFLACAGESFAQMFRPSHRGLARSSFFVSQLVKYIPGGGLAQFASQSSQMGLDGRHGPVIVAKSKLVAAVAGLVWGPVFALTVDSVPLIVRLLVAAGGLSLVLLWPPMLSKVARRLEPSEGEHADDRELAANLRSLLWAMVSIGAAGLAFFVAIADSPESPGALPAIAAYAVAWTIGYLAVPFPGGIGVREAVLTLLLPLGASTLLVAAVVVRVLQIGSELVLALVIAPMLRR